MRLEASTTPHIHQKFEIFWTNIAYTMACPNSKNGPKHGLYSLGVKIMLLNALALNLVVIFTSHKG